MENDDERDVVGCKYQGECIEGCTHPPEHCALFHAIEGYNRTHNLDVDPLTYVISRLHNHGFDGLQEIVVLEAMGLKPKSDDLQISGSER